MKKISNGEYGEKIWEDKIRSQDEVGVICGIVGSLEIINRDTKKFIKLFDEFVKPRISKKGAVLDLGVGPMARLSSEIAKKGFNVTGVDISETTLKYAKKHLDLSKVKVELIKEDITSLRSITKKFDFIFCYATFYHIPPHLTGISLMRINSLLKKKGLFLVEFGILKRRSLNEKIKGFFYWGGHYIKRFFGKGFNVNVSRFNPKELDELITKSGFKINKNFGNGLFLLEKT